MRILITNDGIYKPGDCTTRAEIKAAEVASRRALIQTIRVVFHLAGRRLLVDHHHRPIGRHRLVFTNFR
jgi:hypothetical protein